MLVFDPPQTLSEYMESPRCFSCGSHDFYRGGQTVTPDHSLVWTFHCHGCGKAWEIHYSPVFAVADGKRVAETSSQ